MLPPVEEGIAAIFGNKLEARGERWNEEPALYAVQLSDDRERIRIGLFPLPAAMWRGWDQTVDALKMIADLLTVRTADALRVLPGGVYAVGFRAEGWSVPECEPGTAQASENAADAMGGRMAQRPDRIEVRFVSAVDVEGRTYIIEQVRGALPTRSIWRPGDPPERAQTGDVFGELRRILAALAGTAPPPRVPEARRES